jgi:hypothetical protein
MNENTSQVPEPGDGEGHIAGAGMTEEAELVFRDWIQSLVDQDIRYHRKAIALLAREAMVDDGFRSQVLEDPAGALRALGARVSLPEEFAIRFFENTNTVLNVVLPPRAETVAKQFESSGERGGEHLVALRLRLRSRTEAFATLSEDDWDIEDTETDSDSLPE